MAVARKYSSVSFFCPAHNEEANLPVLIPKVHEFFKEIAEKFEIIIVENGSKDKTPEIADELARKFPEVRVLHYDKGLGYGGALREGFRNSKYEYICYTDADNQYDIREFNEGFKLVNEADIVSGYVKEKAVSFSRKIQSFVWNMMVRALFGVKIRDINCSMKIYKREALDSIKIESISAFIDAEMLIKAKWAGFVIKQFPVTHFERTSGVAIGSSRKVILSTAGDALRFWWRSLRTEILLFLFALVVRGVYALAVQLTAGMHGFISFSDAEFFYFAAAKNLLSQQVFSVAQSAPYIPDAYHTPLYPLFIASLLFLKFPLLAIVLVQDVLAALSVLLIYKIALHLTKSRAIAIVSGILSAIEPMSVYWSGLLMSDIFFSFLVVWSMYLLLKKNYVASAFALGFATLTRPISLFFLPIYILFIMYQGYATSAAPRKYLKDGAVMAVICLAVVSPWLMRNKIVFDTWSLTSGGWYDLYVESIGPFAEQRDIPLPAVHAPTDESRFSFAYTPLFKAADIQVIRQDIPAYLFFQLKRSLWALVSDRYVYLFDVVFKSELPGLYAKLSQTSISALLLVGEIFWLGILALVLVASTDRKLLPWWLFFATLVGINGLISGGINPGGTDMSRYSLPFYPFFFTFAGVGWLKLSGFFKRFLSTNR